jgi:uncharacterized protein (DUF1499 family)
MERCSRGKVIALGIFSVLMAACAGARPDNPGTKNGLLALCPNSPNCVSSQGKDGRHSIAPLTFSNDPDSAMPRLKMLLKNRKDTTLIEADSGYLRVEFHTTFFVDDGEFLLDREKKLIHIRSASRIGYSDLGKNRSRLEEIRRDFAKGGA